MGMSTQRTVSAGAQAVPRRIGFCTDARTWGGSELYLVALVEEALGRGHQVWVMCPDGHPFLTDPGRRLPASVRVLPVAMPRGGDAGPQQQQPPEAPPHERRSADSGMLKRALRHATPGSLRRIIGLTRETARLAGLWRRAGVDLVHANISGSETGPVAARMARIAAIGTIHTQPGLEADRLDLAHRLLEWVGLRCLDETIVASEAVRYAWAQRVRINPRRMRVIYYGMDLDAFRPARPAAEMRREFSLPEGAPVLGVTARLHPMKGFCHLLDAMPAVLSAVPAAHLVVAGDGELRAALEQQAQALHIADRVRFLGFRSDVADVMQVFDVAVLPSVAGECLPYVLMEAMALRKPVVATRFSGIPEEVEDGVTGTLVPLRAPKALAEAVIELLRNPDKARAFGEAGRRRVEERFTQKRMLEETFALFDELIARKSSRQRRAARLRERS